MCGDGWRWSAVCLASRFYVLEPRLRPLRRPVENWRSRWRSRDQLLEPGEEFAAVHPGIENASGRPQGTFAQPQPEVAIFQETPQPGCERFGTAGLAKRRVLPVGEIRAHISDTGGEDGPAHRRIFSKFCGQTRLVERILQLGSR
jgi:hypothetical protein